MIQEGLYNERSCCQNLQPAYQRLKMQIRTMCPMQINLECGSKEELSHVEEPNRCEYQAKMTTPAACLAEDAKQLQAMIAGFDNASKDEL